MKSSKVSRENPETYDRSDLVEKYLDATIKKNKGGESNFNPWFLMQELTLAIDLAKKMSLLINENSSRGICVLCDSGIPLGVLTAQALKVPIHFYRRNPWPIDDLRGPRFIFPEPSFGSELLLVDSHISTGFTINSCSTILNEKGVKVNEVVSPISFTSLEDSNITKYESNIRETVLSDVTKHISTLLRLFGVSTLEEIEKIVKDRYEEPPPSGKKEITGYIPRKSSRFIYLLNAMKPGGKKPQIRFISNPISQQLITEFGSQESNVWSFFAKPDLVETVCKFVGNLLNLHEYHIIVGTEALGTFLALCLAWHNKFTGKLLSTYNLSGWNDIESESDQNVLICSARLRTGVFIKGATELLSRKNLKPKKILILRLAHEGVAFPRRLMLNELGYVDCEIVVLS
jgi:orotate phosphoribosyltransferase